MATADTLRYTRIPLTHGCGAMPAVGFGTLIPDPLATQQATKTALEVDFGISSALNGIGMKRPLVMRCRKCSRRERSGGHTPSLPPSYGTPIIALDTERIRRSELTRRMRRLGIKSSV
jgi:hypothetical protein